MGVSISNTNSAILALCKLHNFCIESNSGDDIGVTELGDASNIMVEGGMSLPRIDTVMMPSTMYGDTKPLIVLMEIIWTIILLMIDAGTGTTSCPDK